MSGTLALLTLLAVASPADVPNPRARGEWVADTAGILAPGAEASLNATIADLERQTGVELAVVTTQDVAGTPKDFATALFNTWGIGKREANNGVLVLLVVGQRRLEIETGYGVEPLLPDGWLGVMQSEVMVPRFRAGDFAGALTAGVARVAERLLASPEAARRGVAVPVADAPAEQPAGPGFPFLPVGFGTLAVGAAGAGFWARHRHLRTCQHCKLPMLRLDEAADDAHLTPGQRTEEALGSVSHDVYMCGRCGFTRHLESNKWFSRYVACQACSHRTCHEVGRATLAVSTQYQSGVEEISLSCRHCGHAYVTRRVIPPLPTPTSSRRSSWGGSSGSTGSSGARGSSGGGSFGGGGSRGGGAGSSW